MNIQMRKYSYRTTGWLDLSKSNIDYIKTCNNGNIGMKSAYLYLYWFSLIFLAFVLIFMNMQIMQIRYIAYLTME